MSTKFTVRKATPVMFVNAVEPAVAFWQGLGFEKTVEVPHGDAIGFAILIQGGVELMFQSRGSIGLDVPALAAEPSRVALYVEVSDLDEATGRLHLDARRARPGREVLFAEAALGEDRESAQDKQSRFGRMEPGRITGQIQQLRPKSLLQADDVGPHGADCLGQNAETLRRSAGSPAV